MKWQLKNRRDQRIAAGTLEQMFVYLKYLVPDGEYKLVGSDLNIPARRYHGKVVYPTGLEDFISSSSNQRPSGE
jgi:hypothetical protein